MNSSLLPVLALVLPVVMIAACGPIIAGLYLAFKLSRRGPAGAPHG